MRWFESTYLILKYARLGDAIVNYIFSISLTLILKEPIGVRAKNSVLRKVFLKNNVKEVFGIKKLPRGTKPEDFVEALIAVLWIKGRINIEKLIEYIISGDISKVGDRIEYFVADKMMRYVLSRI